MAHRDVPRDEEGIPQLQDQRLAKKHLRVSAGTEQGEIILGGKGRLTRLPDLEGIVWNIPLDWCTPNPDQPRSYFDEKKMDDLRATMESVGQQVPIDVVPYLPKGEDQARLFIIDGERRFRTLSALGNDTIRAVIHWEPTLYKIKVRSVLINESRAAHNPIERANVYRDLMQCGPDGNPQRATAVALVLGVSSQTVLNHLKLLKLPPGIQNMIATGTLPYSNALTLTYAAKRYGRDLDLVRTARLLVDNLERAEGEDAGTDDGGGGKLTLSKVRKAIQKTLIEGGRGDKATDHFAAKAIYDLLIGVRRAASGARSFSRVKRGVIVPLLRQRSDPPEVVRDAIREAITALNIALVAVEAAIAPDPLPEIPGKPSFSDFLLRKNNQFGNDMRYKIALELARASDQGRIMTLVMLKNRLDTDVQTVAANLKTIGADLEGLGLCLDQWVVREKSPRGKYEQRQGLRLAWLGSRQTAAARSEREFQIVSETAIKLAAMRQAVSGAVRDNKGGIGDRTLPRQGELNESEDDDLAGIGGKGVDDNLFDTDGYDA